MAHEMYRALGLCVGRFESSYQVEKPGRGMKFLPISSGRNREQFGEIGRNWRKRKKLIWHFGLGGEKGRIKEKQGEISPTLPRVDLVQEESGRNVQK